jgi:hypothetical protein
VSCANLKTSLVAAVTLFAALSHATPATDKSCFDAVASGQKLRKNAKLKDADDKFQVCAQSTCPAEIAADCTKWHSEVTALLPSVTLSAKDKDGKDLIDVKVSLDGNPVATQLDGKAIVADPGVHEFSFESAGVTLVERVVLNEGEKARKVSVRFGKTASGGGGGGGGSSDSEESKPLPVGAIVVGGVGIIAIGVGAGLYVTGSADYPADCDRATRKCVSDANLPTAQDADNRMIAGMWTMIGGGIAFLGGVTWFIVDRFSAPSKKPKESRYAPTFTPTSVLIRF